MMVDFRRSRTRELGVVLVLALLVVDGVLVVMALRNQPEPPTVTVMDPPPVTPTDSPTSERPTSPSPASSPTPKPSTTTPTPGPTTEPVESGMPRELPLSVLNEEIAVRGTPGSCAEGGGSVEITEDGGVAWSPISIPDALAVLRVRIEDDRLWFIGAGSDCAEAFYQRAADSEGWERSGSTGSAWHLLADPESPEIRAPDEVRTAACQEAAAGVVELETALNEPARILCSDGSVHVSRDSAATWTELGLVPGARAMGVADGQPLVAAIGVEGCDGLAVQEPTPEGPTPVGCAEGAADDAVALSFAGQVGFLVAGGATWTTADGGETWDQVGAA
jgi:hypothetical protein